MLGLITSALSLNIGVSPVVTPVRVLSLSMLSNGDMANWGKLPPSVDMAGACPIVIGVNGKEDGYGGTVAPIRKGTRSEWIYESRASLGQALDCSFVLEVPAVKTLTAGN